MLELKNLSVGYGGKVCLENVNLSFLPGMIHTIVGRNGCGKSTLLKTCCGLLLPESGRVLLDEKDLAKLHSTERAKSISYLSQSRNIPNITVERLMAHARFPYLGYPKKLRQSDWDAISHSLEVMRVSHFANISLRELSGGERQRVYLAMLLAQDTPVVLLDEPTTYLDIEHQLSLMDLLTRLKNEGKTIIMVLHDLPQALTYSDRIIAIDENKQIHTGTSHEMLQSGVLSQVFHVDIQRSEYRIEMKSPAASAARQSL